ncbi:MAG: alpha/beta fold hydrolase [Sciscionella sp.]
MSLIPGFASTTVMVPDQSAPAADPLPIFVASGGSGPPLLLLHGYPQTHAMWRSIAPRLAEDFTVVAMDLRGYGRSGKPPDDPAHTRYAKRTMAADAIAVMAALGFGEFSVVGHDRGGRCAYRMALDHPRVVTRLAVLDIVPTYEVYARADMAMGLGYWHWFFLAQPAPFPERLIGADPEYFFFGPRGDAIAPSQRVFAPESLADYRRSTTDPATIHAICADYRAGASTDYAYDRADRGVRKIEVPLLALYGAGGAVAQWYDVAALWRDWASDVLARSVPAGHFLAEQEPEQTYAALGGFLRG